MTATINTAQRIKELNDAFRRTGDGGRILFTAESAAWASRSRIRRLRLCGASTPSPRTTTRTGSMISGASPIKAASCSGRSTTYDAACEFGSEDPADPLKTTRVLTIMLADEY